MKKIFFILAFSTTMVANAQIVTSRSTSVTRIDQPAVVVPSDNYNRFYFGTSIGIPSTTGIDLDGYDIPNAYGVTAGFLWGLNIVRNMPLYIEFGPELTWLTASDSFEDSDSYGRYEEVWTEDVTANLLSLSVPVNVTYRFDITDKFSIAPFAGPNLKFNILASGTSEDTYVEYRDGELNDSESYSEDFDAFDDDDTDGNTATRFQFGYNIGCNFSFGQWTFGYRYQGNFNNFLEVEERHYKASGDIGTNHFTIGYTF